MLNVLIVRGARAVVIAIAVAWLAYIWRIRAASFAGSETGALVVSGLLNGIIVLLVADLLWQLSKALIAYRIALAPTEGASADELARSDRLRTLLPIFRNTLAALIAVVTLHHHSRRARGANRTADRRRRHLRRRDRLRLTNPGQGRAERRLLHARRRLSGRRIHPERQL